MLDVRARRILLVSVSLILLVVMVYVSIVTIGRAEKTAVHISAFPADISITLDGEDVKTGTTRLQQGTYEIEAKKGGYDDYSKTLVLGEAEQTVAIILVPNSEEAMEYGRDNEEEYRKIQAQGEVAAAEAGKLFNELNPIAKHLPDKAFFYSIGYRMDQSDPSGNSIIIEIDASEAYREAALYRIRQLGYDPTDFNINFRNYENPFPL